jgi:hypothetical protein
MAILFYFGDKEQKLSTLPCDTLSQGNYCLNQCVKMQHFHQTNVKFP